MKLRQISGSLKKKMSSKARIPSPKHLLVDVLVITVSIFLSALLRLGPEQINEHLQTLIYYTPIFLSLRIVCFVLLGAYSFIWRYISTHDVLVIAEGVGLSSLMVMAVSYFAPRLGRIPRSIIIIEALLSLLALAGARLTRRMLYEKKQSNHKNGVRTLIYGAGANGRSLAQRLQSDSNLEIELVGFIDDDPKKIGRSIANVPVLGNRSDLASTIDEYGIRQVIIALPNLSGDIIREITLICKQYHIRPQMTPDLRNQELADQKVHVFREINYGDLLNRSPKEIDVAAIRGLIQGKVILVTGAGGSIGSEICRQVMDYNPQQIILVDHSEYNLYQIDQELRIDNYVSDRVVPILVDTKDDLNLFKVFEAYRPTIVFHAAAYKHVHLVEKNPNSSILNNILSTKNLLKACENYGTESFVMISTDKAVNPAGVMGATKRVCEYLVTLAAKKHNRNYCSVRFGNVLGSSGSLIPLLTKQIQAGGPVTITHKDITRYFMLIPEAVKLVLKAATISKPGDINILRMGEPIKILDIAKNLILLMTGPGQDIPITFTGLRPGEKMFEELYITGNELATSDPDILTLPNGDSLPMDVFNEDELQRKVTEMIELAKIGSEKSTVLLTDLVRSSYPGAFKKYQPPEISPDAGLNVGQNK